MPRDDRERGGVPAVGHRDPGERRHGNRRRYARDNLKADPCGAQRLALLAAPAEDKRITAFEPHDG